jgi:hypothetical protein
MQEMSLLSIHTSSFLPWTSNIYVTTSLWCSKPHSFILKDLWLMCSFSHRLVSCHSSDCFACPCVFMCMVCVYTHRNVICVHLCVYNLCVCCAVSFTYLTYIAFHSDFWKISLSKFLLLSWGQFRTALTVGITLFYQWLGVKQCLYFFKPLSMPFITLYVWWGFVQ